MMALQSLRCQAQPSFARLGARGSEFSSLRLSTLSLSNARGAGHRALARLEHPQIERAHAKSSGPSFMHAPRPVPSRRRHSAVAQVASSPVSAESDFSEMVRGTARRYYMVGGKGGVGKTSVSSSLGVKFANEGQPTLVVSTDPAHSLSDSFAQDVSGGSPVAIDGIDNLYAMEIDPEKAREEFRAATGGEGGSGVKDFMDSMGVGQWLDQLSELKLGELLDTPPPA